MTSSQGSSPPLQNVFANHRLQYPLHLELPVQLVNANDASDTTNNNNINNQHQKKLRTDPKLIQYRLLEHGIAFDKFQNVQHVQQSLQHFRADLLQSGCFQNVHVNIVPSTPATKTTTTTPTKATTLEKASINSKQHHQLQVLLEEKNWYRLYVGGGIKQQGFGDATSFSLDTAPAVQMETSIGLVNLTGHLDTTTLQYAVDHHSMSTWNLAHERPLYTALPGSTAAAAEAWGYGTWLQKSILSQPRGSQYMLSMRAALDTMDYEHSRSYKECQRMVSLRLMNQLARRPELAIASPRYMGWEWTLLFRDIMPRRLQQSQPLQSTTAAAAAAAMASSSSFAMDASPEIVQQAGPSLKHSLQWEYRYHGVNDRFNPTNGHILHAKTELAMPPGDVGFWKAQGGWSSHFPLIQSRRGVGDDDALCCCHASFSTGILQPLAFGGMCRPPTVSDRFFCGGPLQIRGFLPSGIGPRSNHPSGGGGVGSSDNKSLATSTLTPNCDSLGGDFFYTATFATSVGLGRLQPHSSFLRDCVRCFAFVNAGTLTGLGQGPVSWTTLWHSSRVAVGAGCSVATPAGRLELTYAIPLRYSPRDARRSFQFGLGFSFE